MVIRLWMWAWTITRRLHTSVHQHWTISDNIIDILQTSVCWCRLWNPRIICSLWRSVCWCRMWPTSIYVACTHDFVDIGQWEVVSPKAYIHVIWHLHILQGKSANGMRLQPRLARTKMECVYLERDISQWYVVSNKSNLHRPWMWVSWK